MQPYLYLGNFGRKPHHYYTSNKSKVQNTAISHTGRALTSRAQPGKRRDVLQMSSSTAAATAASAQNMIRVPHNLRHMVNQHNASAINFFESERLNHVLNKAKAMLATHLLQLENIEVKRVKGKKSQHLVEFTFNNALAQSMPTQKYSKLLQTIIPQHQL